MVQVGGTGNPPSSVGEGNIATAQETTDPQLQRLSAGSGSNPIKLDNNNKTKSESLLSRLIAPFKKLIEIIGNLFSRKASVIVEPSKHNASVVEAGIDKINTQTQKISLLEINESDTSNQVLSSLLRSAELREIEKTPTKETVVGTLQNLHRYKAGDAKHKLINDCINAGISPDYIGKLFEKICNVAENASYSEKSIETLKQEIKSYITDELNLGHQEGNNIEKIVESSAELCQLLAGKPLIFSDSDLPYIATKLSIPIILVTKSSNQNSSYALYEPGNMGNPKQVSANDVNGLINGGTVTNKQVLIISKTADKYTALKNN